jgi:hypothetical protein
MSGQPNGIHVVARVNQTTGTGKFRFVTPVAVQDEQLLARALPQGPLPFVDENARADALAALAPHLPEGLLDLAFRAALNFQRVEDRIRAVTALVPRLPGPLLEQALAAARAIGRADHRSRALAALVANLPEEEKPKIAAEALRAALDIHSEEAAGYVVRVKRANGPALDYPAEFRQDACGNPADTEVTGSLDLILPNDSESVELQLVHGSKVLDTFAPGGEPPEPRDIRPATASAGAAPNGTSFRSPAVRPRITWTATPAATAGPTPTPVGGAAVPRPRYTVQVSLDDGRSWRTVGVGLVTPETTLDPQLLAGKDTVRVRVTATNGFRTRATTETLSVKDF